MAQPSVRTRLLEEKGAHTGLLVTQGFRGIYEVMEQTRGYGPATYDLFFEKPRLLAPPRLTEEIPERVDFRGNALKPIDVEASREAVRRLKKKDVKSVAVCFLFSFLNPDHELKVKELFAEEFPEARVSLSYEVLPQIREFYRLSTTVINAYIQPVMASYLDRLENRMREMGVTTPKLYIMQSNGGVSTFKGSAEKPVATVLSGPAGGVIASMGTCERVGINNIITFDMGGTSCDVALIHQGNPVITTQGKINLRPIALPMLDIHTVSAGGGTIARIDTVGGLQVGPDSAGADPGPVCYDRGGENTTITDANMVTGVLDPDHFLGGRMKLNKAKAEKVLQENIAAPLKLDSARSRRRHPQNHQCQNGGSDQSGVLGKRLRHPRLHAGRFRRRRTDARRPNGPRLGHSVGFDSAHAGSAFGAGSANVGREA